MNRNNKFIPRSYDVNMSAQYMTRNIRIASQFGLRALVDVGLVFPKYN